ncbi:unnamed protein product [Brachionus calyciflorus]|uniref:Uncharacterized protein n=1 Tax=Brachionus calyciflorus TaxID=104777 RepID=A0A813MRK3_9BILA|nr:unnamed protein product [Brachionus calyciflorus]
MLKKSSRQDLETRDAKRLKKSKSDSESESSSSDSDDDNSSSDSDSSTSSSEDSSSSSSASEVESKTIDVKIKKLNRIVQSFSEQLQNAQRKYGKIERALAKPTEHEDKLKKIKKYKQKYKIKIDKLKKRIEHAKIKVAQLTKEKNQATQIAPEPKKTTSTSIKVPYPVLNDKRDMKIILVTLEKKLKEILHKKDINLKSMSQTDKNSPNYSKLSQLETALDSQKDKLNKQIEYLKLSLSLQAINKKPNQDPMLRQKAANLTNKINDLFNYMKNENKNFQLQKIETERAVESPKKLEDSHEVKINNLYEQLNKSLVAYLAHTAATAHSAAAISAVNYNYYSYYQGQSGQEPSEVKVVPLKTELENASSIFGILKEKISSFLTLSKKLNEIKKSETKPKLIADYSDEEEESDLEIIEEKKTEVKENEEEDSEDDEDLEIVMTSELKSNQIERNYLLPSLKASLFPLKASLMNTENEPENLENELIAVEQSKFALTFLANAKTMTNSNSFLEMNFNKRQNVKLSDILYSN